jgi:hypothetical protein
MMPWTFVPAHTVESRQFENTFLREVHCWCGALHVLIFPVASPDVRDTVQRVGEHRGQRQRRSREASKHIQRFPTTQAIQLCT